MKKLLLVGAFALVCLFSNAQDGLKGTWFAGGNVSYLDSKSMTVNEVKFNGDAYTIMPLLGKFISPSVAVGGALGYTHIKADDEDVTGKMNTFTVMPLVRKYWNISGGLYFFGQASLPVAFGNVKDGDAKVNTIAADLALSPGFDLIVNSWFTVEASFNIASIGFSNIKPKGGESTTSWGFNGNTISSSKFGDLTIGVKFLF